MVEKSDELRKKAYAYYSLLTNRLVIKGFEAVRSDLSAFTKKTQERIFHILLNEAQPIKKANKYLRHQIKILETKDQSSLVPKLIVSGIIKRSPDKYKSITPAVGAFLHYCEIFKYNSNEYYTNFPRFPYVISNRGRTGDPLFKKAVHPDLLSKLHFKLDRSFYIEEIVRIGEKFGLRDPRIINSRTIIEYL